MSWEYEDLFDIEAGTEQPTLWQPMPTTIAVGQMGYRTKTTKAGKRLEVEIYPVFGKEQTQKARRAKQNLTPEKIQRVNEERSRRYLVQLADANFTEDDIHLTLTYSGNAPDSDQAQKDVRNFLARVKRRRAKLGLPEVKYIYVIEGGDKLRTHIHMLMSGGIDRDTLEALWKKGYANADRLQPDDNGLEAIARYLTKQKKNRRKWCASKNLKKPKVRTSDTKVSKRRVKEMAMGFEDSARAVLEKVFPQYRYARSSVYLNDVIDGVYIRAVMRRRD